jgi:peptide deformylase
MQIVLYPDPVLRRGSEPIDDPGPDWAETARQMLDLMYDTKGVGLAAPQVGISRSLLVHNPSGERQHADQELVLINPRITEKKGKEWGEEGCLSFPGIYGEVQRAQRVHVQALGLDGTPIDLVAEDFLARVIQHEMDHLKGIIFVDRFSPADKIRVRSQLEELEDRFQSADAAR